ncbi:MAG: hypothetical protein ACTSRK_08180 [Promethearchaeota archaeon]
MKLTEIFNMAWIKNFVSTNRMASGRPALANFREYYGSIPFL